MPSSAALEGRRTPQGSGGGGGSGRNADQAAQSSGFSSVNSSQSVRIIAPGVPDSFGSGPGPNNRNPNDTILTALSNANQAVQTTTAVQDFRQQQPVQQAATPTQPLPTPATDDAATDDAATAATADAGTDLPAWNPSADRSPSPSQPAADSNCDLCRRHGRHRERPYDRHR